MKAQIKADLHPRRAPFDRTRSVREGPKPLVSVVVPVYNSAEYLVPCLDSLKGQRYENLEVILVDDGSTDGSERVCDAYAADDPRFVVIHQANGGQSVARNVALAAARGDFVAFLDSDDWVLVDHLAVLVELAFVTSADIVVGGYARDQSDLDLQPSPDYRMYSGRELLTSAHPLSPISTPAIWGKLYRRTLFANVQFPEGRAHEDAFVTHKVMLLARSVVVTEYKSYGYRRRSDSITESPRTRRYLLDKAVAHRQRVVDLMGLGDRDLLRGEYRRSVSHLLRAWACEGASDPLDRCMELAEMAEELRSLKRLGGPLKVGGSSNLWVIALGVAPQMSGMIHRLALRLMRKR